MKKIEFLIQLRDRLAGLDESEILESLEYWGELIDDRMEEGMNEESAVASVGTPAAAAGAILSEKPIAKLVKARVKPKRRLAVWEIVLFWVGSPIWLSLIIAALAVVLSVYVSIWAVVVSIWAAEFSFAVTALATPVLAIVSGNVGVALFYLGAGLLLAGLAIFLFYGCKATTRGAVWLGAWLFRCLKRSLIRKEAIQ